MTLSFWIGLGLWIAGIVVFAITREMTTGTVFVEGVATGLMLSAGLK